MEESAKFVYLFTTSNTKPDVDPIVFAIESAVRNSIFGRRVCELHLRIECVLSLGMQLNLTIRRAREPVNLISNNYVE